MTPLYDVLSMWPYFGDGASQFRPRKAGLAMAVRSKNTHYLFHAIQARHWRQLASRQGGGAVWAAMIELVSGVEDALARGATSARRASPSHLGSRLASRPALL